MLKGRVQLKPIYEVFPPFAISVKGIKIFTHLNPEVLEYLQSRRGKEMYPQYPVDINSKLYGYSSKYSILEIPPGHILSFVPVLNTIGVFTRYDDGRVLEHAKTQRPIEGVFLGAKIDREWHSREVVDMLYKENELIDPLIVQYKPGHLTPNGSFVVSSNIIKLEIDARDIRKIQVMFNMTHRNNS